METKSHSNKLKEKETKTTVRIDALEYVNKCILKTAASPTTLFNAYDVLPSFMVGDWAFIIEIGRLIDERMYHIRKQGGEHVY